MISKKPVILTLIMVIMSPVVRSGENPPPELLAIIKLHTSTLKTGKTATERRKAADALGAANRANPLVAICAMR